MNDTASTDPGPARVAPNAGAPPADDPASVEHHLARLFRRAGDGAATRSLLRAARDYRQQEAACPP